ncbi:MAG: S8 family serine peptidase [Euryarchaeota archaeon]|nr:S8 family serine peptidase [Euryarchaeota archaeon]
MKNGVKNGTLAAAVLLVVGILPAQALPDEGLIGDALTPGNYIVGFYKDPFLKAGQEYMGEPILAVDHELLYIIVEVDDPALFQARVTLDDAVRYVQFDDPNYAHLNFVPNDTQYSAAGHWGSKKIGAEAAWDRTLGSTSVKVGMIDSGIFATHEDVVGSRLLAGWDFVNNDATPNDESGCSYHGSHTSGTAGATINNAKGIAGMSQHSILPIKGLGGVGCSASSSMLANSLRFVRDQGGHISSNSWGGGGVDTLINDAIQYAHDGGVIHIAAAGNSGPCTNCVGQPWKSKPTVTIIVASTTSTDTQSSFSSEGSEVDVSAPGSSILSLGGGVSTYQTLSGTSMATPHVAGTAALLKAQNPGWTFADVDNRLKTTAVDLGPAGWDTDFGYGRINADAATAGGPPPAAACGDGLDNDGDGLTDYPADPGCTSTSDTDEFNAPSGCSGGPANNCFASATTMSAGGQTITQSSVGATTETGEPAPCGSIGGTVWFNWTPTTSGTATFETAGSNFDTVLAVYTGSSLTALTNLNCNDDISGTDLDSRIVSSVTAGTTYRIQAGGYASATGTTLVMRVVAPAACSGPTGNCFSTAVGITSIPYTQTKSTVGATLETGEPRPCGSIGATVWYTYTPATTGTRVADTMGSNFDTVVAVYTGSSLTALTNVGCNDDISGSDLDSRVTWTATAGVTYRIQVGGYNGATGSSMVFHLN